MITKQQSVRNLPYLLCLAGASLLPAAALAQTAAPPSLGPNVILFDPSMPVDQIQAKVDAIASQQVGNQFGAERYALLFKPGVYGSGATPLNFKVGYYTEVAGLGASPDDVVINGSVDVYNQCDSNGCNALSNFWRSLSNLEINVTTPNAGCYTGEFWAVSQAAPMRRVHVLGQTTFMDYCTGPSYASGGYLGDSVMGSIVNGSQQQFFVRNSDLGGWSNAVWNQVFSGDTGAVPAQSYPNPTYTVLPQTIVSREKPYLVLSASGEYSVFAPARRLGSAGTSWGQGAEAGRSLPLSSFLVADPSMPAQAINTGLAAGKNLLLTPGVYQLDRALRVTQPGTVVLGLGSATLVPQTGTPALVIADVTGVQVAGLIVDAGPVNSAVLLRVGTDGGPAVGTLNDPVTLNDVFFRVGGATPGSATTSLEVNSNNVVLDDIWAWRADHGHGVGWTQNTGDHGLVVNGNGVTALGLAVEHYQKEQVLWNGNAGQTIFYQSELPYDVPSQAAWMDGAAEGYPSYVVGKKVTKHQAVGLGIYSFFNQGIDIVESNAITVPQTGGVTVVDAGTVFLNGNGSITHVVNGVGTPVDQSNGGTVSPVVQYP